MSYGRVQIAVDIRTHLSNGGQTGMRIAQVFAEAELVFDQKLTYKTRKCPVMYGLYLIYGKTGLSQIHKERLSSLMANASGVEQVLVNSSDSLAVCLVAPKYRRENSSYVTKNGAEWTLVDGVAIDGVSHQTLTARALHQLLRQEGVERLHSLNGEFLIVANLGDQTWLVSDRMGQRQHCIARNGELMAVAPSPGATLKLVNLRREIESNALLTFLISNKLRWNDQTIWRNCQVLPAAVQMHFPCDEQVSQTPYWQLSYNPQDFYNTATLAEQSALIFRQAVACRLPEQVKDRAYSDRGARQPFNCGGYTSRTAG